MPEINCTAVIIIIVRYNRQSLAYLNHEKNCTIQYGNIYVMWNSCISAVLLGTAKMESDKERGGR